MIIQTNETIDIHTYTDEADFLRIFGLRKHASLQDEHFLWVFVADEVQKVGGEGMKPGEMNKNEPEQIGNQQIHKLEQII